MPSLIYYQNNHIFWFASIKFQKKVLYLLICKVFNSLDYPKRTLPHGYLIYKPFLAGNVIAHTELFEHTAPLPSCSIDDTWIDYVSIWTQRAGDSCLTAVEHGSSLLPSNLVIYGTFHLYNFVQTLCGSIFRLWDSCSFI